MTSPDHETMGAPCFPPPFPVHVVPCSGGDVLLLPAMWPRTADADGSARARRAAARLRRPGGVTDA
jgi:hypothetical protein